MASKLAPGDSCAGEARARTETAPALPRISLPSVRSLLDFALVLGGTAFATGTGFVLKIGLGRTLGPEALGLFGLCYAVLSWLAMVADLGSRYSLVTLATQSWQEQPLDDNREARRYITAGLIVKLVGGGVVAGLLWPLSHWTAVEVLHKPILTPYLQSTAVGIFLWTLWDGVEGSLHTRQYFRQASSLRIVMDFLRLAGFFSLVFWHWLSLDRLLWIYFLAPLVSLALGLPLVYFLCSPVLDRWNSALRPLMSFGKGIFVYRAFTMLLLFLDSLMLGRYGVLGQVGRYEAAKGMAYALRLISETLGAVLLPKVNLIRDRDQLRAFLRRFTGYLGALGAAGLVWLWVAGHFLGLFGPQFNDPEVIATFRILVISTLVMVPATLMGTVLMSLKRPAVLALISCIQVVIGLALYPQTALYGIKVTAWTSAGLQMLGSVLMFLALQWYLRQPED
jgi:O-antigen/teichoic acid export membrane protein